MARKKTVGRKRSILVITFSKIRLEHPSKWAATSKWHSLKDWQNYLETSSRFFETLPNEICTHLSEKTSKGRFFKPYKLQNHKNGSKIIGTKEKERSKSEEEERRRRVKSNGCTLSFYNSYFGQKKNVERKRSIWRYLLINLLSCYFYVSLSFFSSSVTRSEFWLIPWHSSLRCFDTVFRRPWRYFSIALKWFYPCPIAIKFSLLEFCQNLVLIKIYTTIW